MSKIRVLYDSVFESEDDTDRFIDEEKDEYSNRPDTHTSVTVEGIEPVTDDLYFDLEVPFDIKKTKTYYLLWATWSTGDSFGHDGGDAGHQFIDLFKTESKAKTALKSIKDSTAEGKGNKYQYKREDGTLVKCLWAPWTGYFEGLEKLEVMPVDWQLRRSRSK